MPCSSVVAQTVIAYTQLNRRQEAVTVLFWTKAPVGSAGREDNAQVVPISSLPVFFFLHFIRPSSQQASPRGLSYKKLLKVLPRPFRMSQMLLAQSQMETGVYLVFHPSIRFLQECPEHPVPHLHSVRGNTAPWRSRTGVWVPEVLPGSAWFRISEGCGPYPRRPPSGAESQYRCIGYCRQGGQLMHPALPPETLCGF